MGNNTAHAMGETTTNIEAVDDKNRTNKAKEENIDTKVELIMHPDDNKTLIILNNINNSNFI